MPSVVDLAEISRAVYDLTPRVIVYPRDRCAIDSPIWTISQRWNPALSGFTAAVYRLDRNNRVLAYAGTDSLWDVISDDASIAAGNMPQQAFPAVAAARSLSRGANLYITGHSLGGALAIIAASHTGLPAVTFNAPGVMDACLSASHLPGGSSFFAAVRRCISGSRILNIRIAGDPVSSFLTTGVQTGTTRPGYSAPSCGLNALCRHGIATCIQAVRADASNYAPLDL